MLEQPAGICLLVFRRHLPRPVYRKLTLRGFDVRLEIGGRYTELSS